MKRGHDALFSLRWIVSERHQNLKTSPAEIRSTSASPVPPLKAGLPRFKVALPFHAEPHRMGEVVLCTQPEGPNDVSVFRIAAGACTSATDIGLQIMHAATGEQGEARVQRIRSEQLF